MSASDGKNYKHLSHMGIAIPRRGKFQLAKLTSTLLMETIYKSRCSTSLLPSISANPCGCCNSSTGKCQLSKLTSTLLLKGYTDPSFIGTNYENFGQKLRVDFALPSKGNCLLSKHFSTLLFKADTRVIMLHKFKCFYNKNQFSI